MTCRSPSSLSNASAPASHTASRLGQPQQPISLTSVRCMPLTAGPHHPGLQQRRRFDDDLSTQGRRRRGLPDRPGHASARGRHGPACRVLGPQTNDTSARTHAPRPGKLASPAISRANQVMWSAGVTVHAGSMYQTSRSIESPACQDDCADSPRVERVKASPNQWVGGPCAE